MEIESSRLNSVKYQNLQRVLEAEASGDSKGIQQGQLLDYLLGTVCPRIGVTRLSNIGQFFKSGVEVCQSTRPHLYHNFRSGMNSGSQGKGLSLDQAKISAIMESLESYSVEPRDFFPVLASSKSLKRNFFVYEPPMIGLSSDTSKFDVGEDLLWAKAYSLEQGIEVFVPAELIYFLFPNHYGVKAYFPTSSNGLGAHTSIWGAINQGLYELVERHYVSFLEEMNVKIEALKLDSGIVEELILKADLEIFDELSLRLYSIQIDDAHRDLPFVLCVLGDEHRSTMGFGMHLSSDKAIVRAYTECMQCWVTEVSASREDLGGLDVELRFGGAKDEDKWPTKRTLCSEKWKKRFSSCPESDFDQFKAIQKWLKEKGVNDTLICDLSPPALRLSVVKVVAPGLKTQKKYGLHPAGDMAKIPVPLRKYSVYI